MNKLEKRVTVYDIAALDSNDNVRMEGTNVAEGAVATVRKVDSGKTSSRRLFEIVPKGHPVSFLKVDVEGTELSVLNSAIPLFDLDLIDNMVVEFGPPSRWMQVLQMGSNEGFTTLKRLGAYEFEIRLLEFSQVYKHINVQKGNGFAVLKDEKSWRELINAMNTCNCESYLWVTRAPSRLDQDMKGGKKLLVSKASKPAAKYHFARL